MKYDQKENISDTKAILSIISDHETMKLKKKNARKYREKDIKRKLRKKEQ